MLAMSDRYGEISASIPGLAHRARITIEQTEDGLSRFLQPDPYSRTPDNDGKRIKVISGGWALLNHAKYRELMSAEERKEYNRVKQAEYRSRKSKIVNDESMTVNDNQHCQHSTEAEADSKAEAVPPKPPEGDVKRLPTSPEALAVAALYKRRSTTPWSKPELKRFIELKESISLSDISVIQRYYEFQRRQPGGGYHRRDLGTFLNNYQGELDRALEWDESHPFEGTKSTETFL